MHNSQHGQDMNVNEQSNNHSTRSTRTTTRVTRGGAPPHLSGVPLVVADGHVGLRVGASGV